MRARRLVVPQPDRVREIGPEGFGWIDARLHREGWLALMPTETLGVYTFLCLVANRQGVSWYRRETIGQALCLGDGEVHAALKRLCELDLVAYQPFSPHASEGFRQVLSFPAGGPPSLPECLKRLRTLRTA